MSGEHVREAAHFTLSLARSFSSRHKCTAPCDELLRKSVPKACERLIIFFPEVVSRATGFEVASVRAPIIVHFSVLGVVELVKVRTLIGKSGHGVSSIDYVFPELRIELNSAWNAS